MRMFSTVFERGINSAEEGEEEKDEKAKKVAELQRRK